MQQPAEYLCRAVAPSDLEGRAVYVIDWAEIAADFPRLHRPKAMAWTSHLLDLTLETWLTERCRWRGPGFATIVHRDRIPSWRETLAAVLHELGHWLAEEERQEETNQHRQMLVAALLQWCGSPDPTDQPPWLTHEAPFVRACCHLAHRANEQLESIRPKHLRFSMSYYGISEGTWMTSLEDELGREGSIREILTTEPPEPFTELWQGVTEWWEASP